MMLIEYGFFVAVLCGLFYENGGLPLFCTDEGNREVEIGAEWTNQKGCTCTCMASDNFTFSQCDKCPTVRFDKSEKSTKVCVSNGLTYSGDDKWLSTTKECSLCQCSRSNTIECESATHCTNPCDEGQIAEYGSCCEIKKCHGNATIVQQTRNCLLNRAVIYHGRSIITRSHCNDNFCNCNNGQLQCFPFCELSSNNSYQFWNKLCCPRSIGNKTCLTASYKVLEPGQIDLTIDEECRCLDGQLYCINATNYRVSERTTTFPVVSTATTSQNITSHQGLNDTTMKELFIILCLFCFVILILLAIVFIIRIRNNKRHRKWNRNNRLSLTLQEDTQEFDINHNYRDLNHA